MAALAAKNVKLPLCLALLQNLWAKPAAAPTSNLAMTPGRSADPGNAGRRIVRIASPWLAVTVSVPGFGSPVCPKNGLLSEIQL